MPSVPITYVIGTVGMLAILGIVTLIATTQGISIQTQSTKTSLTDAAQYVASELSTVAITAVQTGNETLAYRLSFPQQLNLNGYAFTLVEDSAGWKVLAYLPSNPTVTGSSYLTFQTAGNPSLVGVCVYNSPSNPNSCHTPGLGIQVLQTVYSGDVNAVVWSYVSGGKISVGLGDLTR